jgi:polyhydroxybutyrate depolymerase
MHKCSKCIVIACYTLLVAGQLSCSVPLDNCTGRRAMPGDALSCGVKGWPDRGFDIAVPNAWDGTSALPILLAFHGGGGNKADAEKTTAPDGGLVNAAGLISVAGARGVVVVRPDGTGSRPYTNARSWNAGGGVNGYQCVSAAGCARGVDDMAYIDDVLAAVRAVVPVDATRVYATGLSNGGAMSHRLACQRADVVAAVVAVGAGNQFAAAGGVCADGVAVLDIHGTADPCWPYGAGGNGQCAGIAQGRKVDVATSTEAWRLRNGCDADTDEESLPDADPTDGTQSTRTRWKGCRHATELIRVEGGGHTWPGGQQYLSADTVGPVPRDFGNALVLDFLLGNPKR